jgi:predicted CXXCH cytochrome family protein
MSKTVQVSKRANRTIVCVSAILALSFFSFNSPVNGGSVVGSRHDLSTTSSPRPCVFCHAPHNVNLDVKAPLWNRAVTDQAFTLYDSPTLDSTVTQPSDISLACLGCHDGVLSNIDVYGVPRSTKHHLVNYNGFPDSTSSPNCERCHTEIYSGRPSRLGLGMNLGNDHPISMDYPNAGIDPAFKTPPDADTGWGANNVRLYKGKVECVSCHDVHNPDIYPFLVTSNQQAALCLTCHIK